MHLTQKDYGTVFSNHENEPVSSTSEAEKTQSKGMICCYIPNDKLLLKGIPTVLFSVSKTRQVP